jgi:hypothetical protein
MSAPSRADILARVMTGKARGGLNQTQGAKMLGISRQRMVQLVKREHEKERDVRDAAMMSRSADSAPCAVKPPGPPPILRPDPLAEVFPEPDSGPVAPPANLADAVGAGGAGDMGGTFTPDSSEPIPDGEQRTTEERQAAAAFDPEDAEAGRELLKVINTWMARVMARVFYKIPKDDPRMSDFKEQNGFLKVAVKRNGDKAASLGWLAKGWKGLIIGYGIEILRVVIALAPEKDEPDAAAEDAPVMTDTKDQPGEDLHTVKGIRKFTYGGQPT